MNLSRINISSRMRQKENMLINLHNSTALKNQRKKLLFSVAALSVNAIGFRSHFYL